MIGVEKKFARKSEAVAKSSETIFRFMNTRSVARAGVINYLLIQQHVKLM